MSCYVKLQGKKVLEKMILVLEKSLIFPQKILYEPWIRDVKVFSGMHIRGSCSSRNFLGLV